MDSVLAGALAPVLRDLQSTGIAPPRIEDGDWTGDAGSPSAMLWSPDGSGTGVRVDASAPESERVAMVADQVQEWVIEQLWGHAPTNWPRCPQHPSTHPMTVLAGEATAAWGCPVDGIPVVPVGDV